MNTLPEHIAGLSTESRNALEMRLLGKLGGIQRKPTSSPATTEQMESAVSFAQEALWFFDRLEPNNAVYNIPQAFRLTGPVDQAALEKSFVSVIQRHSILRTNFREADGKPVAFVQDESLFRLGRKDLRAADSPESEMQQLLKSEAKRPFRLESESLIRATVYRLAEQEYVLLMVVHHIVADFSSLVVLYQELKECYQSFVDAEDASLPEIQIQFATWAAEQKKRLSEDLLKKKTAHWKEKLGGELPVLDFPADYRRPARQAYRGACHLIRIPRNITSALKEVGQRDGCTLYLTLLSAFSVLLHRYTGQKDLIIGSPIDQRDTRQADKLIGYFVNTLPLRLQVSEDDTFREVMQRTKTAVMDTIGHHEVPFEKIVEALQLPRDSDKNPLFQVVFQFLPALPVPELKGVATETIPIHTETAKFDLTFTFIETNAGLCGEIEYNTDLFKAETIKRFSSHYERFLTKVVSAADEKTRRIPLLSEVEERQLLITWNETETKYPRHASVHELFEEQVARTPENVALKFQGKTLSYRDLNARANQLAHYLRAVGVGPDVPVAIAVDRSFEMVFGLLGILKAGGAYVPLDPGYPLERLDYIIKDTATSVLVTTGKNEKLGCALPHRILLDDPELLKNQPATNPSATTTPENLAYIMYTSGSTGKAKGVLIPHRGVVRLVKETNYIQFSSNDIFLQFAPISFDASTLEIWGPLLNGARLAIYPPTMNSLNELGEFILSEEITTVWLTAGLFHQMVDQHLEKLRGVKQLLAGGDVLSVPHIKKAISELPGCRIINGYGPTENTTFTCCYTVPRDWEGHSLPIGLPISNTKVYILDSLLQPTPVGVVGELYIAGDGLAREYLNAPELNQKRFLPDPYSPLGGRMYKTGDRARWTDDGTIEFLGRLDNQVKVRGFRVEPGEIETIIAQHPKIKEAVVTVREHNNGKELIGYVVPRSEVNAGELRSFVRDRLPHYMVPAHFVVLEALPLNVNGKVDRHRLPLPGLNSRDKAEVVAPKSDREKVIMDIWTAVLGREAISTTDNFFELGGHSLIATQIISRAGAAFGLELPLRLLFENPSVSSFSEAISHYRGEPVADLSPIRKRARLSATRLDQLSDSQVENLFQASRQKSS